MPFASHFPKERELFGNPTGQSKGIRKHSSKWGARKELKDEENYYYCNHTDCD